MYFALVEQLSLFYSYLSVYSNVSHVIDGCPVCFRYGLGMIYYKQEKFTLAEVHFRKALAINPYSCVLLCHIGVVSYWGAITCLMSRGGGERLWESVEGVM